MEKKYALLIDAENADIKYLTNILIMSYMSSGISGGAYPFSGDIMRESGRRIL